MRRVLPLLFVFAPACSGSDFQVAGSENDTGSITDSAVDDSGDAIVDSIIDSATTSDSGPVDTFDAGACTFDPGALDYWVDSTATGPSVGTASCPFKTVLEATKLGSPPSGVRTIHVKGGTPQVHYAESDAIAVRASVTLLCEGPTKVRILAGGTCGTQSCSVLVDAGGRVDSCSIGPRSTLTLGSNLVVTSNGVPAPALRNTLIAGATGTGHGIFANGPVELGPGLNSSFNGGSGLAAAGGGTIHVIVDTTGPLTNAFDNNTLSGIHIPSGTTASLNFEGGSASGNKSQGIRLANAQTHTIAGLNGRTNGFAGILVTSITSLTLRRSTLVQNTSVGLWFEYGGTNTLDIGTTTTSGANTFGGATIKNTRVGVYLCRSGLTGSQLGEGDSWGVCPPSQTKVDNCDMLPSSYADVAYVIRSGLSGPGDFPLLVPASCKVGP